MRISLSGWKCMTIVFPVVIAGCTPITTEQERENHVKSLIENIASEAMENQKYAYTQLRDVYVRKRDFPYLENVIARNPDTELAASLRNLLAYMDGKWRLPDKGWTSDILDCVEPYLDRSEVYGATVLVSNNLTPRKKPIILAEVTFPKGAENRNEVIKLIQTLEPESIRLLGTWKDIEFLGPLRNLEELSIQNANVQDLEPLKKLPNLKKLQFKNSVVSDMTPVMEMTNLRMLYLDNDDVTNSEDLKSAPFSVIITSKDM